MAAKGGQQRVIHQDYIVRQRYSNALPPPPGAPKLLEIPNPGLAYYTSPAFASRMARQEPLNIEADAFLGMPINLVGMPGIFDGDESSIQAPTLPPPVHAADRDLLRPLKSLGQPKTETSGVSFLRRTQYTADDVNRRSDSTVARVSISQTKKRKANDISKDEPINILRSVVKSFDIANPEDAYKGPDSSEGIRGANATAAELEAWRNPVHPTHPKLKLVDSYPLLPDLDALTDNPGYMVFKFGGNPANAIERYDERMDVSLLRPLDVSAEEQAAYDERQAAYQADPVHNPAPGAMKYNYEFFLPEDEKSVRSIKRKFDVNDPDRNSPSLYTAKSQHGDAFRYRHQRLYETGLSQALIEHPYSEVAMALYDPSIGDGRHGNTNGTNGTSNNGVQTRQKAAYFVSIMSKAQLKPRRSKQLAQLGMTQPRALVPELEGYERLDAVDLQVGEPDEQEADIRRGHRLEMDPVEEEVVEG
ncbi:hypothetical protein MMC25_005440 [Agyrium rufum]|nr:hypothetical protein [Agyrium rufum]